MPTSATVIDLNSYRKRRQARAMAELMWKMYATRASISGFTVNTAMAASETRRA